MTDDGIGVLCRGVRKYFGHGDTKVEALRGVDFETRIGELSFLVGPSGCGKTTLISIIAGLLDRTAGELSVLGTRLDDLSPSDRVLFRRQNLGFIFQQFNLRDERSIRLERPGPELVRPRVDDGCRSGRCNAGASVAAEICVGEC